MGLFQRMGKDGNASEFLQPGEMACVIEMAVGQEDGLDVRPVQADLLQYFLQSRHFAYQSGVDQHRFMPGGIKKEMKRSGQAADGINSKKGFWRNIV